MKFPKTPKNQVCKAWGITCDHFSCELLLTNFEGHKNVSHD